MLKRIIYILLLGIAFTAKAQEKQPKLIVGIVVDQMSYEYLYRFEKKYGKGGFKRLMKGTNCRSTHYNYVPTYTAPGHASIYTGTTPANHGIVANDWYRRSSNKLVNCVEDLTVQTVGSENNSGKFSPVNLKVNTVTDQLKLDRSTSKVISLSIKNRGAILPGGHLSDGTYWFDSKTGKMISSSFYKSDLPEWVKLFNNQPIESLYLKQTWTTYFPIEQYTESGPDDSPYEYLLGNKEKSTFPYHLPSITTPENQFEIFVSTPFANTYLTDFAIRALENEQLGKSATPDMLCISYSSPDIIGHAFGPQSVEIEDTYIRLDQEIERLLKELDARVGKGKYTVFLTADHAVSPVPQLLLDKKLAGGYLFVDEKLQVLKTQLTAKFGIDPILHLTNLSVYVDKKMITESNKDYVAICQFIADEIRQWEGVKNVYTASQLINGVGSGDKWFDMFRKGYNYHESGDVLVQLESGYWARSKDSEKSRKGTSHGSPYAYDTHVPLLWYGCGIPKKEIFRTVEIIDIAPTISHLLNISFPSTTTGNVIVEIFTK